MSSNSLTVLSETAFDVNEFKLNKEKENIAKLEKEKTQSKDEAETLFIEKKIDKINDIIKILS